MVETEIDTSHCKLAVTEIVGPGAPVLMIHGNSSCKEAFGNQFNGAIGRQFHCIAVDLPGHGRSQNAHNPQDTYSVSGYADAVFELMGKLGHHRYAVLGWSLGGHVGLEMIDRSDAVTGLMITGTPPLSRGEEAIVAGFLPAEAGHLAGQREMDQSEAKAYALLTCGKIAENEIYLAAAVERTDGRAREMMFANFMGGKGSNQQKAAQHSKMPLAIVNGGAEPVVNNEYVASLTYDNLWENKVHLIEGIGHAPFLQAPEIFDPYLERFLSSL